MCIDPALCFPAENPPKLCFISCLLVRERAREEKWGGEEGEEEGEEGGVRWEMKGWGDSGGGGLIV